MSQIVEVLVSLIDENPHRKLSIYPTVEKKVETLARSFEDVGVWEGMIARPAGERYQIAFGHHRLAAAKRLGLEKVPLIVRDLSDEEMMRFMGRENDEAYRTDALHYLAIWEAAMVAMGRESGAHVLQKKRTLKNELQPLDVARKLGWIEIYPDGRERMTHTAKMCADNQYLVDEGLLERDDLGGLSVRSAKDIAQRTSSRIAQIEKTAEVTKRPAEETEAAKRHVAKGAKVAARGVREGTVAVKDIRSEVDVNAYKSAAASKVRETPLFAVFGRALVSSLSKLLSSDATAEKLEQISEAVGRVTMAEDEAVLRQLDFELGELGVRAEGWRKRLVPLKEKLVQIRSLEKKDA